MVIELHKFVYLITIYKKYMTGLSSHLGKMYKPFTTVLMADFVNLISHYTLLTFIIALLVAQAPYERNSPESSAIVPMYFFITLY